MRMGALTDIGKRREINEDSYFVYRNQNLLGGMVADGMGGENAGEIASSMACDIVKEYIMNEFNPDMDYFKLAEVVKLAFNEANDRIFRLSKQNERLDGMGTTATLAIIYKGKLIVVHVGDSRVYLIDDDGIRQCTKDHSYVQELLSRGEITKEFAENHPAKNYITRAVGSDNILKADITVSDYHGETVVICSDGLSNMLCDSQIEEIVKANEDLQFAAVEMITLANKKGGPDNITVIAFSDND